MALEHVSDHPFPERQRLGVGVVDAEDLDALVDPEQHEVAQLVPDRRYRLAVEVDVDDVLVLLGRILGELDGAVRPPVEPLGMLHEPRMVARALNGEIEGELEAVAVGGLDQGGEVVPGAELRVERIVSALGRADGIGAARVAGRSRQAVVAALARGSADRMDRREVEHVEAHVAHVGQAFDHVAERAVAVRIAALGPGEHFVPGGEAGRRAVGENLELALVARQIATLDRAPHHRLQLLREHNRERLALVLADVPEAGQDRLERLLVLTPRRVPRLLEQPAAFDHLERDVLVGIMLLDEVRAPGLKEIPPRLDRVDVARVVGERNASHPAVVVHVRHRRLAPTPLVPLAIADAGADFLVPIAKDVGGNLQHVSHHPFDGMAAAIDLGLDLLDGDPVGRQLFQAFLRDPGGDRFAGTNLRLADEDPDVERSERQVAACLEALRLDLGRHVPEAPEAPPCLGEEGCGIEPLLACGVRVDDRDHGLFGDAGVRPVEAQQSHKGRMRCAHASLRALDVEGREACLHAIHGGNEIGQVKPRIGRFPRPVARPSVDDVEPPGEAVLVAHRHHDGAREGGGEEVSQPIEPLEIFRLFVGQILCEAFGVVALRKGRRGGYVAVELVLLEQPGSAEVPVLGAVEHKAEARVPERQHLGRRASEGLGGEQHIRLLGASCRDQGPPDLARNLVGGIAAKAPHTEIQVPADQIGPICGLLCVQFGPSVVQLRQIAPDGHLARVNRIDRARRAQRPVCLAQIPLRVLLHQEGVLGGVIDHQVEHDRKSMAPRRLDEAANQIPGGRRGAALHQGMKPLEILDRIEASGEPGIVERIHENPVEAHLCDPRQVLVPSFDRPGEEGEEVVDPRRPAPGRRLLACLGLWPRPPARRRAHIPCYCFRHVPRPSTTLSSRIGAGLSAPAPGRVLQPCPEPSKIRTVTHCAGRFADADQRRRKPSFLPVRSETRAKPISNMRPAAQRRKIA